MKRTRQDKIIELISAEEIETQEDLAKRLQEAGFKVTQATVSRDIRELALTKVAGQNGRPKYAAIDYGGAPLQNIQSVILRCCKVAWYLWLRQTTC